jgi:Ca2+-binding RTX toxin-like protein
VNTSVPLTTIEVLRVNGSAANDSFDVSGWTKALIIGGGAGTDTIIAANDVDFTLSATMLLRSGLPAITHSALENAQLIGGGSDNRFTVSAWTKTATLDGAGGTDTLVATDNAATMTLNATALTRTGKGSIGHTGFEAAELTGGAANNTISAAAFAGQVKLAGVGGNDTLTGSAGPSLVLGGAGNDVLRSGAGRTILIGGVGLDRLTGSTNEDVLVDGTTAHDNNAAALALLLLEWSSGSSYNDRVAHLTGTPGGLNGTTHLGGANVTHDTSVDILAGAAALDLFFAKITGSAADSFTDFNTPAGEQRFQ